MGNLVKGHTYPFEIRSSYAYKIGFTINTDDKKWYWFKQVEDDGVENIWKINYKVVEG